MVFGCVLLSSADEILIETRCDRRDYVLLSFCFKVVCTILLAVSYRGTILLNFRGSFTCSGQRWGGFLSTLFERSDDPVSKFTL